MQLNAQAAQTAKDAGMQLALSFDEPRRQWGHDMLDRLRVYCRIRKEEGLPEFVFEEFRAMAEQEGWPLPASSNAWGALGSLARRKGVIENTGAYVPARSVKTHGHPVPVVRAI
jgi:hypothetical protein